MVSIRRALSVVTALGALLALVSSSPALAQSTERVGVQSARDGNTLVVKTASGDVKTIRIAGILAPKLADLRGTPQCGSQQARSYLESLLKGKVVTITPSGSARKGAYQVKLRGGDIGGALIRRGWALPSLSRDAGAAVNRAYSKRAATAFTVKAGIHQACSATQIQALASPRIIGGIDASVPGALPLLKSDTPDPGAAQFCGGTAVGPRWVLTAHHCVAGRAASDIQTADGALNLYSIGAADRIGVISIRPYPAWGSGYGSTVGDIALLEVDRDLSGWIDLVPTGSSSSYVGASTLTFGWGEARGYSPSQLQVAGLPVQYDSTCSNIFAGYYPSHMLCAGYYYGSIATCNGDSGGPLYVETSAGWRVLGVTSFGLVGCPTYGVFADLTNASMNAFIRSEMAKPTASAAPAAPPPPSSSSVIPSSGNPTGGDSVPCPKGMYQQDERSVETDWLYNGKPAIRVVSRIRIFNEPLCAKDLVFILTDKRSGKRVVQLPGSTLGYRKLDGKVFSAPKVSWPPSREFKYASGDPTGADRLNARLVHVAYYLQKPGLPTESEDIELRIVRNLGTGLQADSFGTAADWGLTMAN